MAIFQFVLNPLFSQLRASVSSRGFLVLLIHQETSDTGHIQESRAILCPSSLWHCTHVHQLEISPLSGQTVSKKQDSRNSLSSSPGPLLWNHFPGQKNQAICSLNQGFFSMILRPMNQGTLNLITPHLSLLHFWSFFNLYLYFLNIPRSSSVYKF